MAEFRPTRFEILPVVVKNLLIINALVFLAQMMIDGLETGGDLLSVKTGYVMDHFALHHVFSPLFKPWQLLTHMFMHGGIVHIVFNMFGLWMFGSKLENMWGPRRFFIFYMVCGLAAAALHLGALWVEFKPLLADFENFKGHPTIDGYLDLIQRYGMFTGRDNSEAVYIYNNWLTSPQSTDIAGRAVINAAEAANQKISFPTIGASGAVMGCLAGFGYLFPNSLIYLYGAIPIKAIWAVLGLIAADVFFGIQNSAGDNVARWAHVGGALAGFIMVYFWNKTNRRSFY